MFIDGTSRWDRIFQTIPDQNLYRQDCPPKNWSPKFTRARLESSLYFGIRSSEYQRHEVQFPWCTMRGLCSFRFSQGPMHVCILKNIEGLLLLPLIGYNTLAIEVILNSRQDSPRRPKVHQEPRCGPS